MTFVMGIFVGMGIGGFLVTMAYLLLATKTTKKRDEKDGEYLDILKRNELHFSAMVKAIESAAKPK